MSGDSILIIDDEEQIQRLLRITLSSYEYTVHEAASGVEGLKKTQEISPDLILLDLGLPDQSGYDVLVTLREWYTKPIVIISAQSCEDGIIKALNNGANDYIVKPFRMNELLERIRAALAVRDSQLTSVILYDDLSINLQTQVVTKNNQVVNLTPTEYFLMHLFIRNEGTVLTHQHIIEEMPPDGPLKDLQHLRVYIAQLRKKIENDFNRPRYIMTESGVGYRFIGSPVNK